IDESATLVPSHRHPGHLADHGLGKVITKTLMDTFSRAVRGVSWAWAPTEKKLSCRAAPHRPMSKTAVVIPIIGCRYSYSLNTDRELQVASSVGARGMISFQFYLVLDT